jgi:HEAT repeat protein
MRRAPAGDDFDGWVRALAHPQLRPRAKQHLLRAGSTALPAIRRGLQRPEVMVRRGCVSLLDHLVDDESIADLVAAVEDPDAGVRARALHALACDACKQNACRPGEDLFVPRAIELARSHDDADVRAAAIDTLGKVAGRRPDARACLQTSAAEDRDAGLRSMARRRLAALRVRQDS